MTEHTADIVADLRGGSRHHVGDGWNEPNPEAADLLERIDALRPTCPTCNGTRWNDNCPDCTDGRMPFERMAAIVTELLKGAESDLCIGTDNGGVLFDANELRSIR